MFPELDREQAQQLPDLMTQIRTLGLVRQTEMAAARHMASRVADSPLLQDAPSLQVELARDILGRLAGPAVAVQVAQSVIDESLCPYEPTDPRYSRDPNCAPLETGAIPDTGGTGTGGTIPGVNAPPNGPENAGTSNGY
ncbi:hypothetical protein [Bauldia litoralis]|nr:hypothetical protein [Bauldia litoralis]